MPPLAPEIHGALTPRLGFRGREDRGEQCAPWYLVVRLVPVSINGRSPFPFCVEPSRSRTLVSARTIETVGLAVDDSSSTLTISERLAYPLLRLESLSAASAIEAIIECLSWGLGT